MGPSNRGRADSGHPHHLGQHQTHHFRQHPEITHSSHFGRSLWATRISSLRQHGKHLLIIITWLSHLGFGWGGRSSYLHHYLTQPFRVWFGGRGHSTSIITWLSHLGFGCGGRGHSTYIIPWLSHLGFVWGEGSFYLHLCLIEPFRVWLGGKGHSTYIIAWLSHLGFGWGGKVILLTSLLDSAI